MPTIVNSATFDGINSFALMGTIYNWSNHSIEFVNPWGGDGPIINIFDLTFQNSWTVRILRNTGIEARTNISDVNDGVAREIEFLRMGNLGGTVSLITTHIDRIAQDGPGAVSLTLGVGYVSSIRLGDGNDSLIGGSGDVDAINLQNGNNFLSIGAIHVNTLTTFGGNDSVRVGLNGSIGQVALGAGNNKVTLANHAQIDILTGEGGNDVVTLSGDGRVSMMSLGQGNNVVTTNSGGIDSYFSDGGSNTLNIGSGGIRQIVLSGDGGVHSVIATGFIGSLQVDGSSRVTLTVSGGAQNIQLGGGDDIVTTGANYVQLIYAGDGDNLVTLGTGGAGFIRTGDGDDLIRLNTLNPAYGVVIQGGGGNNTADFSQINAQMTIGLNRYDYQNIGAPNGMGAPVLGFFSLVQVANLIGGNLGDVLTGNDDANEISGLAGNDVMAGLSGDDLLIGGRGNDTLTGGADADTFQFSPGGGRDQITDFAVGTDLIDFTGAARLADIGFVRQGSGVVLTVGTASVLVDNITVAALQHGDNFLF